NRTFRNNKLTIEYPCSSRYTDLGQVHLEIKPIFRYIFVVRQPLGTNTSSFAEYIYTKYAQHNFGLLNEILHVGHVRLRQHKRHWARAVHQPGTSSLPGQCSNITLYVSIVSFRQIHIVTRKHDGSIPQLFSSPCLRASVLIKSFTNIITLTDLSQLAPDTVRVLTE